MRSLRSHTVLRRAPSLNIELGVNAVIHLGGSRITARGHVLSILEAFAYPVPLSKALDVLSQRLGAEAWIELVSSIKHLYMTGVLVDEQGTAPVIGGVWSAPAVHISMLNDRARTENFLSAVAAVVRPGDVVVDIGTGTGVLAVAAARAGARHVYAIEVEQIGRAAEELFAANGVADRITLLPGWSPRVELPERANVLIAEIIGNDPLEEGVMEMFADARRRFLTADARIVPSRLQVFGVPIAIDPATAAKHSFQSGTATAWKEWYGIDFDVLRQSFLNKSAVITVPPHRIRDWPQLANPMLLVDLDLTESSRALVNESSDCTITTSGLLGGVLVYFELELAPGIRLSTAPAKTDDSCNWLVKVWTSGDAVRVERGERFRVSYSYRVDGSGIKVGIDRL